MKKRLTVITVFCLVLSCLFAQGVHAQGIQSASNAGEASPAQQTDDAVKALARDINRKLVLENNGKVAVAQFTYQGSVPPLGAYWASQLTEELTGMPYKSYLILSTGAAGADWTISGEIVDVPGAIRIYTRLIRASDKSIAASFHTDLARNEHIITMLASGGSRSRSSSAPMDAWEPDSWDNPVPYEIGEDQNAELMNRTLHTGDDEDFFLLLPASDGRLVMETTGDIDTYMEFYNAETRQKLADDDDGGAGLNARIRYNVQAGKRYIAKVRGFGSGDGNGETGHYGFRAYLTAPVTLPPDEYEPDDDSSSAKWIEIGTPQQHTFHTGDDVDWVKFQVAQGGRYTIRARGVNTPRLDTYIELFDSNLNSIAEDDDDGEGYDARLSLRLESGLYYLKVTCLDDEPDEAYTISIEAE